MKRLFFVMALMLFASGIANAQIVGATDYTQPTSTDDEVFVPSSVSLGFDAHFLPVYSLDFIHLRGSCISGFMKRYMSHSLKRRCCQLRVRICLDSVREYILVGNPNRCIRRNDTLIPPTTKKAAGWQPFLLCL